MTILQGSKADVLQAQLSEQIVLPSNFDVTSNFPSFEDIPGFNFLLPQAGTYALFGNLLGSIEGSAGSGFQLLVAAVNSTDVVVIANSQRQVAFAEQTNILFQEIINYWHIFTVTKPTSVKLQITRTGSTPTWTTAILGSPPAAKSTFGFLQLIN